MFWGSVAVLVVALVFYNRFMDGVELRHGVTLPDPILPFIHPHDESTPAFVLLYGSILLALIGLFPNRKRLVFAMHAYVALILTRMAVMFLIPLNPPAGMIALRDPIMGALTHARTLTKDLFFSGHTSTLFLFHLVSEGRVLRGIFLLGTAAAACLVLVAHVHYMVDVASAPFFSYGCYRLCVLLHRRFGDEQAPRTA